MSDRIFKIAYLKKDTILELYVFVGLFIEKEKITIENLNEIYNSFVIQQSNNNSNTNNEDFSLLLNIFNLDELKNYINNETNIIFVDDDIYLDDTIENVKKKCLLNLENKSISYYELYMFGKQKEILQLEELYDKLTQNNKIEITKQRFMNYMINTENLIEKEKLNGMLDNINQEIYNYSDLLQLNINNKEYINNIPIGQNFIQIEELLSYVVNPYKQTKYDILFEKMSNLNNIVSTNNNKLVFEFGELYQYTFYICFANDVLEYMEEKNLSQETTIKLYYPYLNDKQIFNTDELLSKKENLLIETEKFIDDKIWNENNKHINLFYDMYYTKKENISYINKGIKEISFILYPNIDFKLPLDIIFKIIHANEIYPFIKYNPGKKQEKIYRLYTNKIAKNGKKIPYLSKTNVFKLMKDIAKHKEVSIYSKCISKKENGEISILDNNHFIIDIRSNGEIQITSELTKLIDIIELEDIIKLSVNPIIESLNTYLSKNGYYISLFETFLPEQNNIEIKYINYDYKLPLYKDINLKPFSKCLSSIFNIITYESSKQDNIILRYKRVSNYNEMDSQEAYIIEMINKNEDRKNIIQGMISNFQLSENKAIEKLSSFVSSLELLETTFKNKKLKIKNNPGFLTTIIKEKFKNEITIQINDINEIEYLFLLPIYIESMYIMSQDMDITNIPLKDIKNICKGRIKKKEEENIKDVVSDIEELQKQGLQPTIKEFDLVFEKDITKEIQEKEDKEDEEDNVLLDLLGMDDEDEDEDEDENDGEKENENDEEIMEGGANSIKDITGMSLSNPNPFYERLLNREPVLFSVKKEGKFKAFSRMCPWSEKRQPVILTKQEKEKIDNEHPGSYNHALEYKSSPNGETYYYICPKYWSLKDGVSLTEEEVNSGKYGDIIPDKAKKVPPNGNIIHFNTGNNEPGFLKPSQHPDGLCIPCCFSSWDSQKQITTREQCYQKMNIQSKEEEIDEEEIDEEELDEEEIDEEEKDKKDKKDKKEKKKQKQVPDYYIKGAEKFPLEPSRMGVLPTPIQTFLETDNKSCFINIKTNQLKPNHDCLLRAGIEQNEKQSFIGVLASLYGKSFEEFPSIKEMKEIIIDALDIDLFISLQNGNLIDIFYNSKKDFPNENPSNDTIFTKYNKSKIYSYTDLSNKEQKKQFIKIINAFENFIDYLKDDDVIINYEYLWDLISIPNKKLFVKGLNLVIMEYIDDDMINNIHIICPTNHYSNKFIDSDKKIVLIYKYGDFYEPIYKFKTTAIDKPPRYTTAFSLKDPHLSEEMKNVLDVINYSMTNYCKPNPSLSNIYNFKTNIVLKELISILENYNIIIKEYVLNYKTKVIGVIIEYEFSKENENEKEKKKEKRTGYIPCYPSAPLYNNYDKDENVKLDTYTWIEDYKGNDYKETLETLYTINKLSNEKIPCKPMFKIVDDNMIVGILTETNQFVPIKEPINKNDVSINDNLKEIKNHNYIQIENSYLHNDKIDNNRIETINKIILETDFYNTFRNKIRLLLNKYENYEIRENIQYMISNKMIKDYDKLDELKKLLKDLSKDSIKFINYNEKEIKKMIYNKNRDKNEIADEIVDDNLKENNILYIPRKNIINNSDNKNKYFIKLADELVRYKRIKKFLFEPKTFLELSDIGYNLNTDEIIMLHSLLTKEYFDDLIPLDVNPYTSYNTYDNTQPNKSRPYSNKIKKSTIIEKINEKEKSKKKYKLKIKKTKKLKIKD